MTMEIREARRADSTAQHRKRPRLRLRYKVQVERCHPDPNTVHPNTVHDASDRKILRMGRESEIVSGEGEQGERERG